MQKRYLLFFMFACCCLCAVAQTDSLSKKDKALLDSMMKNDEFLKLMKEDSKSSVDISIGVGNGAFSTHNNAQNATGVVSQAIFTPSVEYHTKSGFSFGAAGFLTADSASSLAMYQTALSAAYEYWGDAVHTGISYTRYLSNPQKYNNKSLYQNDLYGYIKKAKGIFQPGLSLGFANGNYKEVNLSSFVLRRPLNPRGDTTIIGKDSTDNKSSYFSVSGTVEHDFSFYKLFSKNDELDFIPSLIVNFGSDKYTQTHTNKLFSRPAFSKLKRIAGNSKFQMQSLAASLDCTYTVGKFYIQPVVYLDYYLLETTAQRLTVIYSFTAGLSF